LTNRALLQRSAEWMVCRRLIGEHNQNISGWVCTPCLGSIVMSSKLLTPSDKSLKIPARLDQLWRARAFVSSMAAAAGFEELRLSQIELAVDEACSNIVQHAYARRLDGEIDIRVQVERGRRIVITLVDTGEPFDPQAVPMHDPRTSPDDLKAGGLGLFLIKRAMDDVRFEFNVSGFGLNQPKRFNRLTMTKYL